LDSSDLTILDPVIRDGAEHGGADGQLVEKLGSRYKVQFADIEPRLELATPPGLRGRRKRGLASPACDLRAFDRENSR
jgi:hypothetical protein